MGDRLVMLLTCTTVAALLALGIELYVFTVAYPLFAMIGEREFPAVHAFHAARITYSIGPALVLAAAGNGLLLFERPAVVGLGLPIAATGAGLLVLAITAFVQVPLHVQLDALGRDLPTLARLNANEVYRALFTLVQAGCDVAMLVLLLRR
jgi:hypothetical protein